MVLSAALRVLFVLITAAGAGALIVPWVLYLFSPPFSGKLLATVLLSLVVLEELWSSCLRMPDKATAAPQKDWTVVAVGLAYVGVVYACLAEIHLRRDGFPSIVAAAAGLAVYVSGLSLRRAALRHLGKHWSVQLDRSDAPTQALVRAGPYRWLRHPIYLGAMLQVVGISVLFDSTAGLLLAVGCFCPAEVARARFEERTLAVRLGEMYDEYGRAVPGFLPKLGTRTARPPLAGKR